MFAYKIDVLDELKKKGYTTSKMRNEKLLGENAIQSLRRNEVVGIIALEKICGLLEMQPGDIISYEKDQVRVFEIERGRKYGKDDSKSSFESNDLAKGTGL